MHLRFSVDTYENYGEAPQPCIRCEGVGSRLSNRAGSGRFERPLSFVYPEETDTTIPLPFLLDRGCWNRLRIDICASESFVFEEDSLLLRVSLNDRELCSTLPRERVRQRYSFTSAEENDLWSTDFVSTFPRCMATADRSREPAPLHVHHHLSAANNKRQKQRVPLRRNPDAGFGQFPSFGIEVRGGPLVIRQVRSARMSQVDDGSAGEVLREALCWPCDDMEGDRPACVAPSAASWSSISGLLQRANWWSDRGYPLAPPEHSDDENTKAVSERTRRERHCDLTGWLESTASEGGKGSVMTTPALFYDVEIVSGTQADSAPVLAHRVVLATRVPSFFATMLSSGMSEAQGPVSRVILKACREDIATLVQFVYCGRCAKSMPVLADPERLLGVLELSELCGLAYLSSVCVARLASLPVATLSLAFRALPCEALGTVAGMELRKFYTLWLATRWDVVRDDARFAELAPQLREEIKCAASSLVGERKAIPLRVVSVLNGAGGVTKSTRRRKAERAERERHKRSKKARVVSVVTSCVPAASFDGDEVNG